MPHEISEPNSGARFTRRWEKDDDRLWLEIRDELLCDTETFRQNDWPGMNRWMDQQVEKSKARAA